ncbi:hypothetical protein [Halobacillus sp. H74]|uniref:hypothetical protein n=1 Tax=Halobacillus sp. H74 TaxID=3457436 RepID=UPI003FCC85DE
MRSCNYCENSFVPKSPTEKYCGDECRRRNTNEVHRENYKRDNSIKNLEENFNWVVKAPHHLTTKGFESVSEIGVRSYARLFKVKNWIEVVEQVGCYSTLYNYIVKEYTDYIEVHMKQNLHVFCKNHPYITYRFLQTIGLDKIRRDAGVKKLRYSNDDLEKNFYKVMNQLCSVPTFTEFNERSEIALSTYADRFNLFKTEGKVYARVVEQYCSEEQSVIYEQRRSAHKTRIGKETGKMAAIYDDSDFEEEFHRVFDYCNDEFGEAPTRRGFNLLSKFDDSMYRYKFKISWTEVCEKYGYYIEQSNKTEKQLLRLISDILGAPYEAQKQFPWLLGAKHMPLRCDGYFEAFKLVVEYDGIQHFEPVEYYGGVPAFIRTQKNDAIKNEKISENGLKLLRIPYSSPWLDRDFLSKEINNILSS